MGKIAAAINVSDAIVFIPLLYICMRTYIHTYIYTVSEVLPGGRRVWGRSSGSDIDAL